MLTSSNQPATATGLTATTGTKSKKGGKLGVRKVVMSFDEVESKAKEESQRLELLAKQGFLKESLSSQDTPSNSTTYVMALHIRVLLIVWHGHSVYLL
jgi:hypothetical protein